MKQNFRLVALKSDTFAHYFTQSDEELKKQNIQRLIVDEKPGYPCRVSLADAEIGEEVILLPFEHHRSNSPYRSSGAIFIRKNVATTECEVNEIPKMFNHRLLSLRGYSHDGMMIYANVIEGTVLKATLQAALDNEKIAYLHIHNAKPGCYNCSVLRV